MKKIIYVLLLTFMLAFPAQSWADGRCIPFLKNITSKEYNAHNRNYDVACDDYGSVFVANFEGLLYYDGATWRKIHTPGISRVTRLAKGKDGRIWFGGYNTFGYLTPDKQGRLSMKMLISDITKGGIGEVDIIKVTNNGLFFHTISGKFYSVGKDEKVKLVPNSQSIDMQRALANDSIHKQSLPNGNVVTFSHGDGLKFVNTRSPFRELEWAPVNESNGLIINAVNNVTYDNHRCVWAATDNGLSCIEAISPYGIINNKMGLMGEVNCIAEHQGVIFIGTMEGLYRIANKKIEKINSIDLACWQFDINGKGFAYIATSAGLFKASAKSVTQVSTTNVLSVCRGANANDCYTGEIDGIYYYGPDGGRKLLSKIEKVTSLTLKGTVLTAGTIYGELWQISTTSSKEECLRQTLNAQDPKIRVTDGFGATWVTDNNGRNLSVGGSSSYAKKMQSWTSPLKSKRLNTLLTASNGDVWLGGDFGIILIDNSHLNDRKRSKVHAPYIREMVIMTDSVVWGGYGADMKPTSSLTGINIESSCKNIRIIFSSKEVSLIQPTLYRYRINGGKWSAWEDDNDVEFNNIVYGKTLLEVQALDSFGQMSDISKVEWYLQFPIYLRWWAVLIYLIIFIYAITFGARWRTERLKREKEKLENIVAERTSELKTAYNEQQKISAELSDTLDDLKRTQKDLVRMERTATAGKLTQGLIDRILNPINYINNFSKLTSGLAKDLHEDIEDEKDNMSEDNYEDCEDIIDMMTQNLQKIEQHGVNTTRTLRAMEAMLNNHVGTLTEQDIASLCRMVVNVTQEHFKDDIARHGISVSCNIPDEKIMVRMDAESMNKALQSLFANSIYAVQKRLASEKYPNPEVTLSITQLSDSIAITIFDNGIGIEDSIKEKVFDPFFTTKPTGEASGVGLYLVREIIHDHHGNITLESKKNEYCKFIITLEK